MQAMHHSTTLNDNLDGTFSQLGQYTNSGKGRQTRPPVVKSKNPSPLDVQLAEPNIPPNDAHRRKLFDASLAKLKSMTHDEGNKADEQTVDEMMAHGILGQRVTETDDFEASEESDVISVSDSELSSAESDASEEEGSEQVNSQDPADDTDHDEPSGGLVLEEPTAEENWRTVRGFFTTKDFPPPQPGPMRALMSRPRVRDIVVHMTNLKFSVMWPKDVSMLIVQLVGPESPRPCGRCEKGLGMFAGCVMLSQEVADVLQGGVCSCVNCAWKSLHVKTCDLRRVLSEETAAQGGSAPARAPKPPPNEPAAGEVDRGYDPSDDDLRPRRTRRSERLLLNDDSERHSTRQPSTRQTSAPRPTRSRTAPRDARDEDDGGTAAPQPLTRWADDRLAFGVEVVPPGTALRLDADAEAVRICTLASGKAAVRVPGEPTFKLGLRGMFRLPPGSWGEVVNAAGVDAILHVSSVRTGN